MQDLGYRRAESIAHRRAEPIEYRRAEPIRYASTAKEWAGSSMRHTNIASHVSGSGAGCLQSEHRADRSFDDPGYLDNIWVAKRNTQKYRIAHCGNLILAEPLRRLGIARICKRTQPSVQSLSHWTYSEQAKDLAEYSKYTGKCRIRSSIRLLVTITFASLSKFC